jgi:hypothetical protein
MGARNRESRRKIPPYETSVIGYRSRRTRCIDRKSTSPRFQARGSVFSCSSSKSLRECAHSQDPRGEKTLSAECGTALVRTDDAGTKEQSASAGYTSVRLPGQNPQSGSPVQEKDYPVRGQGCCSESDSLGEHRNKFSEPPGFSHGGGSDGTSGTASKLTV